MILPHNRKISASVFLAALACSDSLHLMLTFHKWVMSTTGYRYFFTLHFLSKTSLCTKVENNYHIAEEMQELLTVIEAIELSKINKN